jgi:hypothetical protein
MVGTRSIAGCIGVVALCVASSLAFSSCGSGGGGFSSPASVTLITTDVPGGSTGVAYSAQFAADFPHPGGAYIVKGGALPTGLSLDAATGELTGVPRQVGRFTFKIAARDGLDHDIPQDRDSTFSEDVRTFTADILRGAPNILPQSPPPAQYRASYAYQIDFAGGTPPYTFAMTGGVLPSGMIVTQTGILGTFPTEFQPTPYEFDVTLTDGVGLQDTAHLGVTVIVLPLVIATGQVPPGAVDVGYDFQIQLASTGAGQPITWSQVLPPALGEVDLDSFGMELTTDGHLRNKLPAPGPSTAGDHRFTVQVTDEAGQVATRSYNLIASPGPILTSISPNSSGIPGPYTVNGFNFQPGATLTFKPGVGQTVIQPSFSSALKLTFASAPQTPASGGGLVSVKVTNPDGGTFTLAKAYKFPAATLSFGSKGFLQSNLSSTGLDAKDVSGDGFADVVHCGAAGFSNYNPAYTNSVTSTQGGLIYYKNNGVSSPVAFTATSLDSGNYFDVKFQDVNNDTKPDIVALGATQVRVWLNGVGGDPLGKFSVGPTSSLPSGFTNPSEMAFGNLTPDGVPDLVFGVSHYSQNNGQCHCMANNGSGSFSSLASATNSLAATTLGVLSVTCLDVDNDGRDDVFAGNGYQNSLQVLGSLSITPFGGGFSGWTGVGTSQFYYSNVTGVASADFLGNGTKQVVLMHDQDPQDGGQRSLELFTGTNLSQNTKLTAPAVLGKCIAPIDGDFDNKMDFVMSAKPSDLLVYRGSTNLTLAQTITVTSGTPSISTAQTGRVAAGDVDGDGRDDVLATTSYWASDYQPNMYSGTYTLVLAGNGNPLGVVYYLNSSQ